MVENFFCLRTNALKCKIENNFGIFRHITTKAFFELQLRGSSATPPTDDLQRIFFLGKKTFSKFLQALFYVYSRVCLHESGKRKKSKKSHPLLRELWGVNFLAFLKSIPWSDTQRNFNIWYQQKRMIYVWNIRKNSKFDEERFLLLDLWIRAIIWKVKCAQFHDVSVILQARLSPIFITNSTAVLKFDGFKIEPHRGCQIALLIPHAFWRVQHILKTWGERGGCHRTQKPLFNRLPWLFSFSFALRGGHSLFSKREMSLIVHSSVCLLSIQLRLLQSESLTSLRKAMRQVTIVR